MGDTPPPTHTHIMQDGQQSIVDTAGYDQWPPQAVPYTYPPPPNPPPQMLY